MIFEVNSIKVAKEIEYVVRYETFRAINSVVLLPGDNEPFPRICHGGGWKKVQEFIGVGVMRETIERYRELNAIVITLNPNRIEIIDLAEFMVLVLNCPYEDALSYLEYLLL